MPGINACFVSYPHLGDRGAEKFVTKFVEVLRTRLALQCRNKPIFFDEDRLNGGDFIDQKIATELCRSACMVMFFVTHNFDRDHPYCAMEYLAMRDLEAKRLAGLPANLAGAGLIIPVVFKGESHLPAEIKNSRKFHKMSTVQQPRDFARREYVNTFDAIAERIASLHRAQEASRAIHDCDCSGFCLPDKVQVDTWLDTHHVTQAAPFRTGGNP